jgi:hypothetical protein
MALASGQILFDAKLRRLHRVLAVSQMLVITGIVGLACSYYLRFQSIGGPHLIFVFLNIFGILHAFAFLRTDVGTPIQAQGIGVMLVALVLYALNVMYGLSFVSQNFDTGIPYFTSLIMAAASLYYFVVVRIVGYCYRLKRQQAKEKIPQMG